MEIIFIIFLNGRFHNLIGDLDTKADNYNTFGRSINEEYTRYSNCIDGMIKSCWSGVEVCS